MRAASGISPARPTRIEPSNSRRNTRAFVDPESSAVRITYGLLPGDSVQVRQLITTARYWLEAFTNSHILWGEDNPDAACAVLTRLAPEYQRLLENWHAADVDVPAVRGARRKRGLAFSFGEPNGKVLLARRTLHVRRG